MSTTTEHEAENRTKNQNKQRKMNEWRRKKNERTRKPSRWTKIKIEHFLASWNCCKCRWATQLLLLSATSCIRISFQINLMWLKWPAFNFLHIHFGQKSVHNTELTIESLKCWIQQRSGTDFIPKFYKHFWTICQRKIATFIILSDVVLCFFGCVFFLLLSFSQCITTKRALSLFEFGLLPFLNAWKLGFKNSNRIVELIINLQSFKQRLKMM